MPLILYLVRHGEGHHNLEHRVHIQDATLTNKGKAQCLELRDNFPDHERISTVVTSPLRRAIQTAAIAFAPAISRNEVNFISNPLAQEMADHPCDIGHSRAELETQLPELLADREPVFDAAKLELGLVEDGWNSKVIPSALTISAAVVLIPSILIAQAGKWGSDKPSVEKRAAEFRTWLFKRAESRIVVVTHGAFLHFLTEDWTGDDPSRGTGYLNCETRVFKFTDASTELDAHLVEDVDARADHVTPTTGGLKTMHEPA